jgi:hypothetical protein
MYAGFFCGEAQAVLGDLRSAGIRCVYTDYRDIEYGDLHIANAVARQLNLQHAPYAPRTSPFQPEVWVPFLDDLITLSEHEKKAWSYLSTVPMCFWVKIAEGCFV